MIPLDLNSAADLVDVAIQKAWGSWDNKEPENFNKICNVETGVTDYYLKETDISDLGLAGRITQNASVIAESPVQGFDQTFTQVEFGKMLAVTKHMLIGITR